MSTGAPDGEGCEGGARDCSRELERPRSRLPQCQLAVDDGGDARRSTRSMSHFDVDDLEETTAQYEFVKAVEFTGT